MKIVLALLAGAVLGVAATRLRSEPEAPAVTAGPPDPGPERVAIDVSAFGA
ncbi:MAG TPA: hypothetical protein VK507_00595 [Iamia sp.]|nr:hypothetical protein [Iamia sp.]